MAVIFHIPGPLRAFTGGKNVVEVSTTPPTVREALNDLWALHPGVRDRVITEAGSVREHVNIFVGNEDIRYTGGLETPLAPGAEISIIPAISGGRVR